MEPETGALVQLKVVEEVVFGSGTWTETAEAEEVRKPS